MHFPGAITPRCSIRWSCRFSLQAFLRQRNQRAYLRNINEKRTNEASDSTTVNAQAPALLRPGANKGERGVLEAINRHETR